MNFRSRLQSFAVIFALVLSNFSGISLAHEGHDHTSEVELLGIEEANDSLEEGSKVSNSTLDFEETKIDELVENGDENLPTKSDEFDFEEYYEISRKQQLFLTKLKSELELAKTNFKQVSNMTSDTERKLLLITEEKQSLNEQLNQIDTQIVKTKEMLVDLIEEGIVEENELALVNEKIAEKEVMLESQKALLRDYFKAIYKHQNEVLTVSEIGEIDALRMLFSDNSVGDNLKDFEYFSRFNSLGKDLLNDLEEIYDELRIERLYKEEKVKVLSNLQSKVEDETSRLELQKESKSNILRLTNGQEAIYQQLLEQSEKEKAEVYEELKQFNDSVNLIETLIKREGVNFDPEMYESLLDEKTKSIYQLRFSLINEYGDFTGFSWPVDPTRGISAYFRDPSYVGVFGVHHNAVDLPAYQRTPVKAAADGVVYKAKDNGYGYSYIILAHTDGFKTVYGHMNEILVSEGQVIPKGYVIGLSGGMPGTLGAGFMTTGPHLHFEMMYNSQFVDPLQYLDLTVLSEQHISWLPERYRTLRASQIEAKLQREREEAERIMREQRSLREIDNTKLFEGDERNQTQNKPLAEDQNFVSDFEGIYR